MDEQEACSDVALQPKQVLARPVAVLGTEELSLQWEI